MIKSEFGELSVLGRNNVIKADFCVIVASFFSEGLFTRAEVISFVEDAFDFVEKESRSAKETEKSEDGKPGVDFMDRLDEPKKAADNIMKELGARESSMGKDKVKAWLDAIVNNLEESRNLEYFNSRLKANFSSNSVIIEGIETIADLLQVDVKEEIHSEEYEIRYWYFFFYRGVKFLEMSRERMERFAGDD